MIVAPLIRAHPGTIGLLTSLGGVWASFVEVLPDALRVLNLVIAFLIGVISFALKVREWKDKRRAKAKKPPAHDERS